MSRERWIEIEDGKIMLYSENDGWSYMRDGAERSKREVTLEELDRNYDKELYRQALKLLTNLKWEKQNRRV